MPQTPFIRRPGAAQRPRAQLPGGSGNGPLILAHSGRQVTLQLSVRPPGLSKTQYPLAPPATSSRCPSGGQVCGLGRCPGVLTAPAVRRRCPGLQRVVGAPNPPHGATNTPLRWQGLSPMTSPSEATPWRSKPTLTLQPSTPRATADPSLTHIACTPPAPDLPPMAALPASQTGPHDPSGRRPQTTARRTCSLQTPPAGKGKQSKHKRGQNDTRRPNGLELSCLAARATVHPFSHILAGNVPSNFPHASRVSCSELLCGLHR